MTGVTPAVELRHVSKAFGDRRVLDDVSLVVPPGRAICILGRSGTGKSVTLKHIVGLLQPDAGHVLVEGEDITGLPAPDLARVRKRIGLLFQHAALFDSISVGENVAFPLRRHTRKPDAEIRARAQDLLAQLIGHFINFPDLQLRRFGQGDALCTAVAIDSVTLNKSLFFKSV